MTWENFAPWVPVVALGGTSGMALQVLALLGLLRKNHTKKHILLQVKAGDNKPERNKNRGA